MIDIIINNLRNCEMDPHSEKIRVGDNLMPSLNVISPECFGEYDRKQCAITMICKVLEGDIKYDISTEKSSYVVPITTDLTDHKQTVKIYFKITHAGNVIGTTNSVSLPIRETEEKRIQLTPRDQFDRVINEQRATIEAQKATIDEQAETIGSQGERITELSGEVTELTTENTRLEALTETQRETIQNMIDNPPQPRLETPDMIVPEAETKQYTPQEGYDGFASFTVKGNKYLNVDLQKFLARAIDFDLEIQADNIGGYLCYAQTGLINCRLTGNPTSIGQNAFSSCSSLQTIELPSGITSIGQQAFSRCSSLQTIELPSGITSIGQQAFQYCSSLQTIELPSGITSIGQNAFSSCSSLQTIELPSGITSIGQQAFSSCSSLQTIELPSGITSIGYQAFSNCTSLTEINLPSSLTSISGNAFQGCTSLTNLTIAQGFNCNGLNVSSSTLLTAETIVACLEALADRTGQTAYTIAFGTTNLNKLTAEQKAIAINKNWNLA